MYRIVKGEEEDRKDRDYDESHTPLCRHIEWYSVTLDDGDVIGSDRNEMEGKASLDDLTRFSNAGSDT